MTGRHASLVFGAALSAGLGALPGAALGTGPGAPPGAAQPSNAAAEHARLDPSVVNQRSATAKAKNAFAARSWLPPAPPPRPVPPAPPPPPPATPEPPRAPPLPFKFAGRLEQPGAPTSWYLLLGERLVVVAVGDVIDGQYRVDAGSAGQLAFTYLPLQQQQLLSIGAAP
jgi:hypothetical protein